TFSPEITETTPFYVSSYYYLGNSNSVIGAGASTSSSAGASPYYSTYGGQKAQYIFRASELTAQGIEKGLFKKLSFFVTSSGTATRNGFSIRMGHTSQNAAVTNAAIGTGLTTVYSAASQTVTSGVNSYTFTTPFAWDGVSNVVVEVVYSNNNTGGGTALTVSTDVLEFTSTLAIYADNVTAEVMLATLSSSNSLGTARGNTTVASRPQIAFEVEYQCESARVEVVATITEAPAVVLNEDKFTMCEGDTSDLFTITSGLEDYDTFEWSPTEGVSGDASSGFAFNPTTSTVYTLTASNEEGCATVATVN